MKKFNKGTWSRGEKAENEFLDIILSHPEMSPKPSTEKEDSDEHIDLRFVMNGRIVTVDVKGLKLLTRRNGSVRSDLIWVELKGVNRPDGNPNKGWLNGKADYIAFEMKHFFFMVNRKELKKHTLRNLKNERVEKIDCFYNLYGRVGQGDALTVVSMANILNDCPDSFLLKKVVA